MFFDLLFQPMPGTHESTSNNTHALEIEQGKHTPEEAQLISTLLEILCLFIDKHTQRIRSLIIRQGLGKHVVNLVHSNEKFLIVGE